MKSPLIPCRSKFPCSGAVFWPTALTLTFVVDPFSTVVQSLTLLTVLTGEYKNCNFGFEIKEVITIAGRIYVT